MLAAMSSPRRVRSTATSNFGVSRRESHDSSGFYERFPVPVLDDDDTIERLAGSELDRIIVGSSADMSAVRDNSVALVVTSPPYFAGKAYEEDIGRGHIPDSYHSYLDMLRSVFRECVRVLEPGGRIAVNVANLGRRPYRSLSADVIAILQDDLGLLLRGEVIWVKSRGASGNCAWGSFQQPTNPVLRDLSERIVIASKGRFDRAKKKEERHAAGLPSASTITRDEFMDFTTDVWEFAPESASRIGHPAPFPVELPERLINLYTYAGDVVLDPFMGSGTSAVAAVRTDRHFLGYDTDAAYVDAALGRVEAERDRLVATPSAPPRPYLLPASGGAARTTVSAESDSGSGDSGSGESDADFLARASRDGRRVHEFARDLLAHLGFSDVREHVKLPCGVEVNFEARDALGGRWYLDVSGAFSSSRPGLRRTDTLWKAIGKAAVIHEHHAASGVADPPRLLLLSTDLPQRHGAGGKALRQVNAAGDPNAHLPVFDVIGLRDTPDMERLKRYAAGDPA